MTAKHHEGLADGKGPPHWGLITGNLVLEARPTSVISEHFWTEDHPINCALATKAGDEGSTVHPGQTQLIDCWFALNKEIEGRNSRRSATHKPAPGLNVGCLLCFQYMSMSSLVPSQRKRGLVTITR